MSNKLVIVKKDQKIISSLLEGRELVQINVEDALTDSLLGNIYLGKVKNIVKNINAAFIEIANGQMCYYSLEETNSPIFVNKRRDGKITIGDELLVQVAKENIKTKAPVVTTELSITGKYVVLTHGKTSIGISNKISNEEHRLALRKMMKKYKNKEYGLIVRTNAQEADKKVIEAEVEQLIKRYEALVQYGVHKTCFSLLYQTPNNYLCDIRDGYSTTIEEIITDDVELYTEIKAYLTEEQPEDLVKLHLYDDKMVSLNNLYGLSSKLEKALQERVWLKSGGYLVIQPTEALTVIDVNTGKAIAGKKTTEETFFKLNMESAKEIAKQVRLRNLSGIIIIDFIDMKDKNNKEILMEELRKLFKSDPIKTTVVDMTALHLVEVTRKKVRKPLLEQMRG